MIIVDFALKNCKIITSGRFQEAGLAIEYGKIVSIPKSCFLPKAENTIDCEGKWVIPGGIDAHVHFRTFREDWKSAFESAVAGGVTFVIDHGFGTPPSTTLENLNKIKAVAEEKSVIDFGISGSVNPDHPPELLKLAKAGLMAFGESICGGICGRIGKCIW